MVPYSRPKCSDVYTLSHSKLLENHTLHDGRYLYSPYMAVPPLGPGGLSPYIESFLNLSTTVTCPKLPKEPLHNGQVFSATD